MTVPGGPTKVIEDALMREFGIAQSAARNLSQRIRVDLDRAGYHFAVQHQAIPLTGQTAMHGYNYNGVQTVDLP